MKTIEQKVKEIIKEESAAQKDNQTIKNYQKATNEFKSLVKKGVAEPRGNNLLSVEEAHLNRSSFNVSITSGQYNV